MYDARISRCCMKKYFLGALSFLALSSICAISACDNKDSDDWEPDCDKKTGEYEKCKDGLYIRCFIDADGEFRWLTEGCECANEKACVKSEGGEKTAE